MKHSSSLHIPRGGSIILPISMSRSNNSQSAAICYDIVKHCLQACEDPATVEIIVLYTTSIYYNSQDEIAWDAKKRLTSQMISHKAAFSRIVRSRKELPCAVHFRTWEQTVLDTPSYQRYYQNLRHHAETDPALRQLAKYSIGSHPVNDASVSFLVEETVVVHMLRQKLVPLPSEHTNQDNFRLVVYPGPYIAIDLYQWKHHILPQKPGILFGCSQYNAITGQLYNFDDMELPADDAWERELSLRKT